MMRIIRLSLWFMLGLAMLGASQPIEKPMTPADTTLAQCDTLFTQGKFTEAIPLYEQFIAQFPTSNGVDQAMWRLGQCYIRTNQSQQAIDTLEKLHQQYPTGLMVRNGTVDLFKIRLAQGKKEQAQALMDEIYTRWPGTEFTYEVVYTVYQQKAQEDLEQAQAWLTDIAQKNVLPDWGYDSTLKMRLDYLSAKRPDLFLEEALPVAMSARDAQSADALILPMNIAQRIYLPLLTADRIDEADSIFTQSQQAIQRLGNPRNMQEENLTAYFSRLTTTIITLLRTPNTPSARFTPLCTRYYALWMADPPAMIDRVIPPVRDTFMRDATAAEWLPPYAQLVAQLPKDHPTRPAALLLLGQFAQSQALHLQARGGDQAELMAQAERAYRTAVTESPPGTPAVLQACSNLCAITNSKMQVDDVNKMFMGVTDPQTQCNTLLWLADYYFNSAAVTPVDAASAAAGYTQLLQLAPRHAQAGLWQYRLAYCLQKQGKTAAALSAYQKLLDAYPTCSAVVAATRAIAALKGGK